MKLQRILWGCLALLFFSTQAHASEMIINGDFSITPVPAGGIYGWVSTANPSSYHPESNQAIQPDTTLGYVCVIPGNSGSGYANSFIFQQIRVPRDPLPTNINFAYQYFNDQPFGSAVYLDAHFGSVEIMKEQASGFGWDATPTPGWTQKSVPLNLSSFAGQNVTLRFRSFSDGSSRPSYMVVDDVSLNIITATKTNTPTLTPTATITMTCTISATSTPSPTMTPTYTITPTITQTVTVTPWVVQPGDAIAFPNPVKSGEVNFMYSLESPADITIDIYNSAGFKAAHLEDSNKPGAVNQKTSWNIDGVAPGVYIYQVIVKGHDGQTRKFKTRRVVVAK